MPKFLQGFFKPKFPEKYQGDPTNIIYRSSWELKLFSFLDLMPTVVSWQSEEIVIPYLSPVDGKTHRYFVDARVDLIDKDGKKQTYLIEVKPANQTTKPELTENQSTRTKNAQMRTYLINQAKWTAAEDYAKKKGWKFKIITESELFNNG